MTLLSTRDEDKRMPQLNRDDWIAAALTVLVEEGIDAVQVTQLSRLLEVTRGSFYWHFKSRDALLEALLAEWRARNTGVMVDALTAAQTLSEGILELFAVWVDHTRFDPRLDQAVRDWSRRADGVLKSVAQEDDNRVRSIAAFFETHGYEPTEAFIRARVIYFTQLSYYSLGVREPLTERAGFLSAYYQCFTGNSLGEGDADAFLARMARNGVST